MTDNYVLRKGERYRRTAPGDWYESQVQALVGYNAIALFPEYFCARIEPYFRTPAGDVQPDLVLVRRDLTGWGLIEVELDTHSFTSHVLPQVNKMTWARGDAALVGKLQQEIPALTVANAEALENLLSGRPEVYLVTHGSSKRARDRLNQLRVHQIDIDILRNLDSPNDALLVVRDFTVKFRLLSEPAFRSTSPLTRRAWTLHLGENEVLPWIVSHVSVSSMGAESLWRATRTSDGIILMEPGSVTELEGKVRMRVWVDDVNQIIHFDN